MYHLFKHMIMIKNNIIAKAGSTLYIISGMICIILIPFRAMGEEDSRAIVKSINDEISIHFSGTLQPRFTVASDDDLKRVGFGVRRARLNVSTDISEKFGVHLQLDGTGTSAFLLDMWGEYYLSDRLTLRAGRFVGAQPRSYTRTLHTHIDAIDRASIAVNWSRMTIGSTGRDYGLEAIWDTPHWELRGFLHNGYDDWGFRSEISDIPATGNLSTEGMAYSTSATHWPSGRDELELGAFASINTSQNPATVIGGVGRNYITWSTHAYWGPAPGDQPYRVKADVIGIHFQEVVPFGVMNYIGGSLYNGFLIIPQIELYFRGEYWYGDGGNADAINQVYATVGTSYSFSALQGHPFYLNRLMLAYQLRTREHSSIDFDDPAHVLILQAQIYF